MIRCCSLCHNDKELNNENFHSDKSRPLGYMYNCKVCESDRTKKRNIKNPRTGRYGLMTKEQKERKYITCRKYSNTNKGKAISSLKAYQVFDKKKGYECNITVDFLLDIRENKKCVYCGHSPTGVDRIDNSKGHIVENCVPCCKECNIARMDNFSHEEMFIIGNAIRRIKELRIRKLKNK